LSEGGPVRTRPPPSSPSRQAPHGNNE
jgi:hypothetical protein